MSTNSSARAPTPGGCCGKLRASLILPRYPVARGHRHHSFRCTCTPSIFFCKESFSIMAWCFEMWTGTAHNFVLLSIKILLDGSGPTAVTWAPLIIGRYTRAVKTFWMHHWGMSDAPRYRMQTVRRSAKEPYRCLSVLEKALLRRQIAHAALTVLKRYAPKYYRYAEYPRR